MDDKLKLKTKSINTQIKVKTTSADLIHRLNNIFLNRSVLSFLLTVLVAHPFIFPRLRSPLAFCFLLFSHSLRMCVGIGSRHVAFHAVVHFSSLHTHPSVSWALRLNPQSRACLIDCKNIHVQGNMLFVCGMAWECVSVEQVWEGGGGCSV